MAPFPIGNVSTLRYSSYLKALVDKKHYGFILIYTPTSMAVENKERSGCIDGLFFQYSTRITWRRKNILIKLYYLIVGLFSSVKYIKKNGINALILYGENSYFVNAFYWIVCRMFSIKYFGDRSEYPSMKIRKSNFLLSLYSLKIKLFDGMIIMTRELVDFYSRYSSKEKFTFLLPMTIDVHRFANVNRTFQNPYIAVVFGTHNRDGLLESILSYEKYINEKGGTFDLVLIGNYSKMPNKNELDEAMSNFGISNRITIRGVVPIYEIPSILSNASCLLTTPNMYISGGFPTKLGEYMLSGTPIVATIAGELLDYVVNGEDMLMSNPGDIDSIAEDLLFVEKNEDRVSQMAVKAKVKASTVFCADSYVDDLISFLS